MPEISAFVGLLLNFSILDFVEVGDMDVLGKRCVVKSTLAGEWVGVVVSEKGHTLVMVDARRAGDPVGDSGFPAPADPLPVTEVWLVDVVSVVPVENVEC